MLSIQTLREHLLDSADLPVPLILALLPTLVVISSTGVSVVNQALFPTLTSFSGPQSLLLTIPMFSMLVWGLVLPYTLARDRPNTRVFVLSVLFLLAMGSYLLFFADWWRGFQQGVLFDVDERFLLFVALLKDVLICALLKCLLWNVLRRAKKAAASIWAGDL